MIIITMMMMMIIITKIIKISHMYRLTLSMLKLLSSKAQEHKDL